MTTRPPDAAAATITAPAHASKAGSRDAHRGGHTERRRGAHQRLAGDERQARELASRGGRRAAATPGARARGRARYASIGPNSPRFTPTTAAQSSGNASATTRRNVAHWSAGRRSSAAR